MKQMLFFIIFGGMVIHLAAQTSTQNYIVTTIPNQMVSNPSSVVDDGSSSANANSTIQYFDGLGRLSQTVLKAFSITSSGVKDLVSNINYDPYGREWQKWLPVPTNSNTGEFTSPTDFTSFCNSQYGAGEKPYSTIDNEPSPLNRVAGQTDPGVDWYNAGKKKMIEYTTNGSDIKLFTVVNDQLTCNGTYSATTLYGQKTTDEDGKTVEEFTDKQGRKVLSRTAGNYDTYFVYDDLDNLRYVLPPLASDPLGGNTSWSNDDPVLKQYAYLYIYDGRKRCTSKRLPSCDWIYMVYDKADRLVMSQDGNQRTKTQWTVNKYDIFGRLLYSGLITNSNDRSYWTAQFSSAIAVESFVGSANENIPGTGYSSTIVTPTVMLSVNYYDNYSFLSLPGINTTQLTCTTLSGYTAPDATPSTPGYATAMLTGTKVYHLDNPALFEVSALYYDKYGRVVQTRASNHLGGYDITYNALDFTGKPTATLKTHGISGASDTYKEYYTYTYDKAQRLLTTTHKIGDGGSLVTLVSNAYDNLGRLQTKTLGGVDATSYSYNVRSWVSAISGNRFTENLCYNQNTASLTTFTACYNGNIAGIQSNIPSESLGNRAYTFAYDGLNRLTTATSQDGKYSESYQFDKMGNITNLYRGGLQSTSPGKTFSTIDNLINFNYNGNQLMSVYDNGSSGYFYGDEEFVNNNSNQRAYDANGNMMHDASNCGIWAIGYNVLNLPNAIQFQLGHQTLYTYSAAGTKLKVVDKTAPAGVNLPVSSLDMVLANPSVASTTTTDYVGNMIYQNGSLQMILLPEGYWQAGVYYYYLKDHLGSNRVVMKSDGSVVESSNFYPSGMRFGESVASGDNVQPYRHIGKEMQSMHGLNWYDNGARMRQVDLPVWTTVDPLAEKYYSISPYAYCAGNLINSIDIDGNIIVNWHACSDASYGYVEKMPNNDDMSRIDLYQHSTSTKGNVIVAPYFHGNIASPTPIYPSDIKNGKYFGEMMKYSAPEAWNNIIENGGTLVLHVCFSGVDGGIAQMISKANRNILVIAPDGYDVIQSNGVDLGPFYSYDEKTGKASNPGKWIYYRNGKRLPYTGTQSKGGKYIKFEGCAVECNASTQEVDYEKYNQDLLEQTSPRQQDRLHVGENGYEGSYWATDDYLRQFGKPDKKKIQ